MDWFRHDSNANLDDKLQEVLLDYGLEGYGLYWYCLELIVGKVSPDNITFELKHDARVIARNTGSTPQKVEEMMRKFVQLGLFENENGSITCFKVARRLMTSATSNPQMRNMIQNIKTNQDVALPSRHRHDEVMPDKIRLDKIRKENTKGTRLPKDWQPTAEFIDFCKQERPDLNPEFIAEEFKDYWVSKAGADGVKLDWLATWRNWVRRQREQPKVQKETFGWRNDDTLVLKKAAALGVYTSGKSRFEILAAIDRKEGRV